ncbi:MAG: pyridoxal-dependent decarboxylase [Steroidobacteraceae bacterium]
MQAIADATEQRDAWLHVDGAFGLWASASPALADSQAHRAAISLQAAYIAGSGNERDPHEFVPEESRRARAAPVYATLRSLGRNGLAELIERCCRHARRFAQGLRSAGFEVLNEVVLNQVLVVFGDAERTRRSSRRSSRMVRAGVAAHSGRVAQRCASA